MSRITMESARTKDAAITSSSRVDEGALGVPSVVGRDSVGCSTTTPEPRDVPQLARPNTGTLRVPLVPLTIIVCGPKELVSLPDRISAGVVALPNQIVDTESGGARRSRQREAWRFLSM